MTGPRKAFSSGVSSAKSIFKRFLTTTPVAFARFECPVGRSRVLDMSKTLALGKLLQRCTLFPLLAARVLRVAPRRARVFGSAAAVLLRGLNSVLLRLGV